MKILKALLIAIIVGLCITIMGSVVVYGTIAYGIWVVSNYEPLMEFILIIAPIIFFTVFFRILSEELGIWLGLKIASMVIGFLLLLAIVSVFFLG